MQKNDGEMKKYSIDWILALLGGVLLALMLDYNSLVAKHSSPLFASWLAHGIGAIASFFFVVLLSQLLSKNKETIFSQERGPWWAYLGGIPGAIAVALSAITVNSELGLSGTLALMLVGQVFFGLSSDIWGLFGTVKRGFIITDCWVILFVLTGSGIIIFFRP